MGKGIIGVRCESRKGDSNTGKPLPRPLPLPPTGELTDSGDLTLSTELAAIVVHGTATGPVATARVGPCSAQRASLRSSPLAACRHCRRYVEYQWFLIALSVRPGNNLAISAHRFPRRAWAARIKCVSSARHGALSMSGSRKLSHRVRHCLGVRPGKRAAMLAQRLVPQWRTKRTITASSWAVQGRRLSGPVPARPTESGSPRALVHDAMRCTVAWRNGDYGSLACGAAVGSREPRRETARRAVVAAWSPSCF